MHSNVKRKERNYKKRSLPKRSLGTQTVDGITFCLQTALPCVGGLTKINCLTNPYITVVSVLENLKVYKSLDFKGTGVF